MVFMGVFYVLVYVRFRREIELGFFFRGILGILFDRSYFIWRVF